MEERENRSQDLSRRAFIAGSLAIGGGILLGDLAGCSPATSQESDESATISFTPGTYTASAHGQHGDIEVSIEFSENDIESFEVTENTDTGYISSYAVDILSEDILKYRTADIDTVSGATMSSMAILSATQECFDAADAKIVGVSAEPQTVEHEDEECDVVVVGAGSSGVVAAMRAATTGDAGTESSGLSVILVEQLAFVGGSYPLSGGVGGFAWGDPMHEAGEYPVITEDEWVAYLTEKSDNDSLGCLNEGLQRAQYQASWPAYELMLEHGGPWDATVASWTFPMPSDIAEYPTDGWVCPDIIDESGEDVGTRISQKPVADWVGKTFASMLDDIDNIDLRCNTRAEELIVENDEVKGVKVFYDNRDDDTQCTYEIRAKKVILATGSPIRNQELCLEHGFEFSAANIFCGGGSTGLGITMTQDAGFDPIIIGKGGMAYNGLGPEYGMEDGIALGLPGYPIVNKSGERYFDETLPDVFTGRNTVKQEDAVGYLIADSAENMLTVNEPWYYIGNDGKMLGDYAVEKGWAVRADTLEELPDLIGVPKERFMQTMEAFQKAANGEQTDEFVADTSTMLMPTVAPFYALSMQVYCTEAYIGLKTASGSTGILSGAGEPIANLYGSGTLIGPNVFYDNYPIGGGGLTNAFATGYIAGSEARDAILAEA